MSGEFNEDEIQRRGLPRDVFSILHDLAYSFSWACRNGHKYACPKLNCECECHKGRADGGQGWCK